MRCSLIRHKLEGTATEKQSLLETGSTMTDWLLSFSLFSLLIYVYARCPIGTTLDPTPTMWLKAEENCIFSRKGHLTSVSSALGNSVLRQISSVSCAKEFWLGGSWDTESTRQWTWTDGRRFAFTNWATGACVTCPNPF